MEQPDSNAAWIAAYDEAIADAEAPAEMFPSGNVIDICNPDPALIVVEDLAHHLSLLTRYNGGCRWMCSVAEHAVLVRDIVVGYFKRPDLAGAALHHDDHEALLSEIITTLKGEFQPRFDQLAAVIDAAIATALGLNVEDFHHPIVKSADAIALAIEAKHLTRSGGRGFRLSDGRLLRDVVPDPLPVPLRWYGGLPSARAERVYLNTHRRDQARDLNARQHGQVIRLADFTHDQEPRHG